MKRQGAAATDPKPLRPSDEVVPVGNGGDCFYCETSIVARSGAHTISGMPIVIRIVYKKERESVAGWLVKCPNCGKDIMVTKIRII